VQVKLGADYITDNFAWKLLAATEDGDGYDVYLKDKSSDKYAKWRVNDKGVIVKGEFLSKSQLLEAETHSSSDFDDDGYAGLTYADDSSRGGVGLGKTQLGWALKKGEGPSVQFKLGADYITDNFGWKLLAATEDGDGYDVYLKDKSSDNYAKWHVDDKGGIVKGEFLSKSQLLEAETRSSSDFDDDGMIGHDMNDGSSDGNMSMVESSESYILGPNDVHLILTGSANINGTGNQLDNIIDGNVGKNILDGKDGIDMLTGYQGADIFVFSVVPSFGDSVADHITDFNPAEGDRLQISKNAFGISKNDSPTFQTVERVSQLNDALASTTTFVYHSTSGSLYFNKNGVVAGFGSGGIFAILDNAAQLRAVNIDYI
jgi:Ca2+-binding RTX toxin-like protein